MIFARVPLQVVGSHAVLLTAGGRYNNYVVNKYRSALLCHLFPLTLCATKRDICLYIEYALAYLRLADSGPARAKDGHSHI